MTKVSLVSAFFPQPSPSCIFAGVRGFLDKIDEKDVNDFEAHFSEHIYSVHPQLVETISSEGQLSEATEAKMREVTVAYVDQYLAAKSA